MSQRSTRNRPKHYRKTEQTREYVFKTAMEVMSRDGYNNTTIRKICKEADISIGTFYNYFDSKSDVILSICEQFVNEAIEKVSTEINGENAFKKISRFFKIYAQMNYNTGLERLKILYNTDEGWHGEKWQQIVQPLYSKLIEIITVAQKLGEINTLYSADELSKLLLIYARGVCYDWCIHKGEYDIQKQMEKCIDIVLTYATT